MGTQDAKREKQMERAGRRKADKSAGRLSTVFRTGVEARADWAEVSPQLIQGIVVAMQLLGGAVTFGLSRDGGAHMVTLLLDGERETVWIGATDDVDVELRRLYDRLDALLA